MKKRAYLTCGLACFVYVVILVLPVEAVADSYLEDFTSKQYCDTLNTTAWWDTVVGELRLHPFELTLAGSCDMPGGQMQGIAVSGDHVYVANGGSGLQVADVTDPANPTLVGSCDTPGPAWGVAVSGDYAYVAADWYGLQVIDVTDPTNPHIVGNYHTPDISIDVVVSGDHAYIADGLSGLQVIDITRPTNPTLAGMCDTPGSARSIDISGDYVYVADGFSRKLQVINISRPTRPRLAGHYDTPASAWGVAVSGDYAYVADAGSGLQVIDISDPADPVFGGSCSTADFARELVICGDYAYVANNHSGLAVIDVKDPRNPRVVASHDTPTTSSGVAVSGGYAYVADDSGLQVIRIAEPVLPPMLAGRCLTKGSHMDIAISGDYAYVAVNGVGLLVIDISDPTNPEYSGSYRAYPSHSAVAVSGDYAYFVMTDQRYPPTHRLLVIDIGEPTNPRYGGVLDTRFALYDVAVSGDYAYVAAGDWGMLVVDITNPTHPRDAGRCGTPGRAYGVALSGDYAYIADSGSGLQVIDISEPTDPTPAGSYEPGGDPRDVAISGDYAYVANGIGPKPYRGGLWVINISDPRNPTIEADYPLRDLALGVAISGDYAYIASRCSGLELIDLRDPASPTLAGCYDTPDHASEVAVAGDYCFVADRNSGLHVIEVFQREINTQSNSARSLPLDESDQLIVGACLNATYSDSIRWELSADSGSSWQEFPPGAGYWAFISPGSDLLWRSTHVYTGKGTNPTCSNLLIEWLHCLACSSWVGDVTTEEEVILVPVEISDVTALGVYSADLALNYDAAILEPTGFDTTGTLVGGTGWLMTWNEVMPGKIEVAMAGGTELSGEGTLVVFTFGVVEGAPCRGCTDLELELMLNEGEPCVEIVGGGRYCVPLEAVSGAIHYYGCAALGNVTPPIPGVDIAVALHPIPPNSPQQSAVTDSLGEYTFGVCVDSCYMVVPGKAPGELFGISSFDASLVLRYVGSSESLLDCPIVPMLMPDSVTWCPEDTVYAQQVAADVDGNDTISEDDARIILKYCTRISQGRCGEWVFYCDHRDYCPLAGSMADEDYVGVLLGDVSGNWVPGGGYGLGMPGGRDLIVSDVTGVEGELVSVPVYVDMAEEIVSLQFGILHDPELLTVESVGVAGVALDWQMAFNALPGTTRVALAGADPIGESGEILLIQYRVTMEAGGSGCSLEPVEIVADEGRVKIEGQQGLFLLEGASVEDRPSVDVFFSEINPNPASGAVEIMLGVPVTSPVEIRVYDVSGRLVRRLVSGEVLASGEKTIRWDGTNLHGERVSSGVYLVTVEMGNYNRTHRVVLVE